MRVDFNNFPGKFTRLVLSGGGPRGLALLGALHYIDEARGLNNIKEYWGTSVGSIIILLLSIGYTPFEAFHQFFMLQHFADPNTFDIQSILETTAFCPIEIFGTKIKHFIEQKLGKGANPTFFDLYKKFGNKIHIIGANVDKMCGQTFDVDNYPLMNVIDAIEISCDLPYVFTKKQFEGQTFVDGGFINHYPINEADDGENHVLGLCVLGDTIVSGKDYIGWIYRLLSMPIMELYRMRLQNMTNKCVHVELMINGISMIEMSPSQSKKIELFSAGYQQCRDYLSDLEKSFLICKENLSYSEERKDDITEDNGWDLEIDWDDNNEQFS